MQKKAIFKAGIILLMVCTVLSAQKNYNGPPMFLNVNAINFSLKKTNGEGQFSNQYSWMLTGTTPPSYQTEEWFYPADRWHSQMLYQIYNPLCFDDDGFTNEKGQTRVIAHQCINGGKNDYSWERRRFRPPYVTVDGIPQYQAYTWELDPDIPSDIIVEWEDIYAAYGMRAHVKMYGYSNENHDNYFIYQATLKFTGETRRPIEIPDSSDFFPSQTVNMWWPIAFSFGPSKAGEYFSANYFRYEGEDDLDSWFSGTAQLPGGTRDSLKIAYYWDYKAPGIAVYPNGSTDDSGDPDRITGHLHSPQIPGYALLHAAKNSFDPADDDVSQPYAIPHATILNDLWGRIDVGLRDTYIGDDSRGRFPLDPVTEGFIGANESQKGPMRFVTVGPYELTLDHDEAVYDSVCVVYAIGVGSINYETADSVGRAWLENEISDSVKNAIIMTGKDSLFQTMDRANWVWNNNFRVPAPPPSPDVVVNSDADRIIVEWSYPSEDYYLDPETKVDDWQAWRVYRKKGAATVNDPADNYSGERWERVFETTDRNEQIYIDTDVVRGVSYYYAVTAMDDGSQNTYGLIPGQALESSRYANRSQLAARSFKAGLNTSKNVRVVPNPATLNAGAMGFPGNENQILFAQLPYKCKLMIFTETGDLVDQIDHIGTDQQVWFQKTDNNQYIASGIYILLVREAEDTDGNKLPDQFEKFVIIR
jgi:hypothetical protein